jgi:uncharacterized protein GlcG (DUF336 family)
MPITLSVAEKLIQAAKAKAVSQNVRVSIAVVDILGDFIAACRKDGMPDFTPDLARGKADGLRHSQRAQRCHGGPCR